MSGDNTHGWKSSLGSKAIPAYHQPASKYVECTPPVCVRRVASTTPHSYYESAPHLSEKMREREGLKKMHNKGTKGH